MKLTEVYKYHDVRLFKLHAHPEKLHKFEDSHSWRRVMIQTQEIIKRILGTKDLDFKKNIDHSAYLALALYLKGKHAGNNVVLTKDFVYRYRTEKEPVGETLLYTVYDAEHKIQIDANGINRSQDLGAYYSYDPDKFIQMFKNLEVKNNLKRIRSAFAGGGVY